MKHDIRWTEEKVKQRLELISPLIHRKQVVIEPFRYKELPAPPATPPLDDDLAGAEAIPWNSYWGEWETDFMMQSAFTVPSAWGEGPVALYLPLGEAGDFSHPEALAYVDGQILAACDRHHQELMLPQEYCDGQEHTLVLHGWTGFSLSSLRKPPDGTRLLMRECAVVQFDAPTREFVTAAKVALGVARELGADDPTKGQLLNALDRAITALDTRAPLGEAFYESISVALELLKRGVSASGAPLDVDIVGVGHAHIDVAWLWTLQRTRHKVGRTFSTALRLMDEFPEYRFSQSQAQLYRYAEEDYPELFDTIKERVKEGRWEVMGGTWVEPDCNAIGAESLARQFMLGIDYFRSHFDQDGTPVLWLPDTFGYSWSLPQLIKEAGFKYFITHKMSWNQYNRMPFQSMWWQGLDGTRVLTHFLTTPETNSNVPYWTTYNGDMSPKQVRGTWELYQQKETHNELITGYGYGDGGGGPTREMLERLEHSHNHPGLPRTRAGTVREFLQNLEKKADELPVWNGEFYLEYHRGTYTSQSRTKRNNRKSEFLLHDAEFLAAWAAMIGDYSYPQAELQRAWELVCLNQFHDILPGSSIGSVYEDAERDYAVVRELGEGVREAALSALTKALGAQYLIANPTSFGGGRYAFMTETLPDGQALVNPASGASLPSQAVEGGTLLELNEVEPYSLLPLKLGQAEATPASRSLSISQASGCAVLENDQLRVEIDPTGDIRRIYDKRAAREVLAEGERGNVFQLFEDRPMNYDAWDIDMYYDDKMWHAEPAHEQRIIEDGPLRVGLEQTRRMMNSTVRQRIYLCRDSARIDFDTHIDWHDQHVLLKVAFPVNVLSTSASYDIQWGNVERPTHRNTSWDWARFETCAYKYADLSEGDYGVSLLNDCKHGYDIRDHVMRLTLLKSATAPDPNADQGGHYLTYSLLPHASASQTEAVRESYDLNDPLIVRRVSAPASARAEPRFLVKTDAPNVVIETVKRAEDGQGLIVRLYENARTRGPFRLLTGFDLDKVYRCNLLEENQALIEAGKREVPLAMKPYQMMTVRLVASV